MSTESTDAERLAAAVRGRNWIYAALEMIGDSERTDHDLAKIIVVNEGDITALLDTEKERDAAAREAEALREEVGRLRELLVRASDKLCHYATDYPQPDTLSIINDCDRALARGHYREAPAQPSADDVGRAREIEKCDSGRFHCFVWFDRKELCAKCKAISAALTTAREQGRTEGAREQRELDVDAPALDQCPACYWHPGHEPDEWFREEAALRNPEIAAALRAEGAREMRERVQRLALAYADTKAAGGSDDAWSSCARELAEMIATLPALADNGRKEPR